MEKLKDAILHTGTPDLSKEEKRLIVTLSISSIIFGAMLAVSTGMWQFLAISFGFADISLIVVTSLHIYDALKI